MVLLEEQHQRCSTSSDSSSAGGERSSEKGKQIKTLQRGPGIARPQEILEEQEKAETTAAGNPTSINRPPIPVTSKLPRQTQPHVLYGSRMASTESTTRQGFLPVLSHPSDLGSNDGEAMAAWILYNKSLVQGGSSPNLLPSQGFSWTRPQQQQQQLLQFRSDGSSSAGGGRSSKKPKQNKTPQCGLDIARLQEILEEQRKAEIPFRFVVPLDQRLPPSIPFTTAASNLTSINNQSLMQGGYSPNLPPSQGFSWTRAQQKQQLQQLLQQQEILEEQRKTQIPFRFIVPLDQRLPPSIPFTTAASNLTSINNQSLMQGGYSPNLPPSQGFSWTRSQQKQQLQQLLQQQEILEEQRKTQIPFRFIVPLDQRLPPSIPFTTAACLSSLVNAWISPSSSGFSHQMEPPSNQINTSNYSLLSWPDRMVGMKRPWPFNADDISNQPSFPNSNELPSIRRHGSDRRNTDRRNGPSGSGITVQVDWDRKRSGDRLLEKSSGEKLSPMDGGFLTLGPTLPTPSTTPPYQDQGGSEQPSFSSSFPTVPGSEEGTGTSEGRDEAADDLNLKL